MTIDAEQSRVSTSSEPLNSQIAVTRQELHNHNQNTNKYDYESYNANELIIHQNVTINQTIIKPHDHTKTIIAVGAAVVVVGALAIQCITGVDTSKVTNK